MKSLLDIQQDVRNLENIPGKKRKTIDKTADWWYLIYLLFFRNEKAVPTGKGERINRMREQRRSWQWNFPMC